MDLNDFIYRDDTAETLGEAQVADDSAHSEDAAGFAAHATLGATAVGGVLLGMSHLLGHAGKHL